jgi:hypothetical protein
VRQDVANMVPEDVQRELLVEARLARLAREKKEKEEAEKQKKKKD